MQRQQIRRHEQLAEASKNESKSAAENSTACVSSYNVYVHHVSTLAELHICNCRADAVSRGAVNARAACLERQRLHHVSVSHLLTRMMASIELGEMASSRSSPPKCKVVMSRPSSTSSSATHARIATPCDTSSWSHCQHSSSASAARHALLTSAFIMQVALTVLDPSLFANGSNTCFAAASVEEFSSSMLDCHQVGTSSSSSGTAPCASYTSSASAWRPLCTSSVSSAWRILHVHRHLAELVQLRRSTRPPATRSPRHRHRHRYWHWMLSTRSLGSDSHIFSSLCPSSIDEYPSL